MTYFISKRIAPVSHEPLLEVMRELVEEDREFDITEDPRALYYFVGGGSPMMDALLALRYCKASRLKTLPCVLSRDINEFINSPEGILTLYYYYIFSCRYNNFSLISYNYFDITSALVLTKPLSRVHRTAQKHQAKVFINQIRGYGSLRYAGLDDKNITKNSAYMGGVLLCTNCIHPSQLRELYKQATIRMTRKPDLDEVRNRVFAILARYAPAVREELAPFMLKAISLL